MQLNRKLIAQEIIEKGIGIDLIEAYRALTIMMVGYRFGLTDSERSSAKINPTGATIVQRLEAASDDDIRGKTWIDFAQDIPECSDMTLSPQEQAYVDAFLRLLNDPQLSRVTIKDASSVETLKQKMQEDRTETTELQNAVRGNVRMILAEAVRKKFATEFCLGKSRFHSSDRILSQIKREINPTVLALERLLAETRDT